jgi:acyl-CoA thioesterase I
MSSIPIPEAMLKNFLIALLICTCAQPVVAAMPAPPAKNPSASSILVLGDSLSSAHRIAASAGWVHLLELRLQSSDSQYTVINESISGETTSGGMARLPQLLTEVKPRIVIVELGANDGLRGLPLAEINTNMHAILNAVRNAGARSVLLGIELPINYGPQYRDGLRSMYRGLAQEFNAPLVPFLLDGVAQNPELMQDDGLHPKAEGEPKVLDNIWPLLEPVLKTVR